MDYLKVFVVRTCGYLIDIVFGKQKRIISSENFYKIPKATNGNPNIFSIFCYQNGIVKNIIKSIKYKGDRRLTKQISQIIFDYLLEDIGEKQEMNNSPPRYKIQNERLWLQSM